MGASSKKSVGTPPNKKSIFIIAGVFVVILLLGFWYYQSQHPNYRDLEKQYGSLNIPSDWQTLNSYSRKGLLGVFCIGQDIDVVCPALTRTLQISSQAPVSDSDFLTSLVSSAGFTETSKQLENCTTESSPYYCTISAKKGSVKMTASISKNNSLKEFRVNLE